mmetsp:Transcript_44855/g.128680  ORF Transcript_44855/g.128680 Transcript_44855/m.128680 type:complete len:223 (+) Transcript_44855:540-1208(+)
MSWKRSSHFWPFLSKAALGLLCTGFCCRLRFTGAGSSPGEEADRPNGLLRSAEPAGPCKNSSSDRSEPFAEPALPPTFGLTCAPAPTRTEGSSRTSSMTTTCSSDSSNSTTASSSSSASSSAAAASAASLCNSSRLSLVKESSRVNCTAEGLRACCGSGATLKRGVDSFDGRRQPMPMPTAAPAATAAAAVAMTAASQRCHPPQRRPRRSGRRKRPWQTWLR